MEQSGDTMTLTNKATNKLTNKLTNKALTLMGTKRMNTMLNKEILERKYPTVLEDMIRDYTNHWEDAGDYYDDIHLKTMTMFRDNSAEWMRDSIILPFNEDLPPLFRTLYRAGYSLNNSFTYTFLSTDVFLNDPLGEYSGDEEEGTEECIGEGMKECIGLPKMWAISAGDLVSRGINLNVVILPSSLTHESEVIVLNNEHLYGISDEIELLPHPEMVKRFKEGLCDWSDCFQHHSPDFPPFIS